MGILKTKPLTELLSQSISPNVSSALLFTPSGSLLASGASPNASDAKRARTHAALAANIWASYERIASQGVVEQWLPELLHQQAVQNGTIINSAEPGIKSLTLELSNHNLHIQLVAHRLLICLIGPKQPTRQTSSSSSVHSQDETRATPPRSIPHSRGSSSTGSGPPGRPNSPSRTSPTRSTAMGIGGSLAILKTQAQGLVSYLEKELRGFELPEGL